MEIVTWTDSFVTGLGVVDRQHRRLVELINRLGKAIVTGKQADEAALLRAFECLREHAVNHFADEERLMINAGIDKRHYDAHQRAHAHLIDLIDALWRSRAAASSATESLLEMMSPWFVQHTLGMDMSMARQIKLLRQGQCPERACALASAAQLAEPDAALDALRQLFQAVSRRNLTLEQDARERIRDFERVSCALIEARYRLDHPSEEARDELRTRAQELEHANRALLADNQRLKDVASTDGLLGIANRSSFDDRLQAEWRRARRDGVPLSLLMIDVDHFKRFNDTYGHPAGDRCLQVIANGIATLVHRPGDFFARYGGEELVVLLPNTDLIGAGSFGERICEHVRSLEIARFIPQAVEAVTVSIGASGGLPDEVATSGGELLRQADEALYRAKAEGRNRLCRFGGAAAGAKAARGTVPARASVRLVSSAVDRSPALSA